MRQLKALVLCALFGVLGIAAVAATYTQTLLNDGVNVWALVSSDTSVASAVALKNGATTVVSVDPVNGVILLSGLVGALPTCTTALKGAVRVVTDSNSTTTGGTVAGSGSNTVLAICNGTNWINN